VAEAARALTASHHESPRPYEDAAAAEEGMCSVPAGRSAACSLDIVHIVSCCQRQPPPQTCPVCTDVWAVCVWAAVCATRALLSLVDSGHGMLSLSVIFISILRGLSSQANSMPLRANAQLNSLPLPLSPARQGNCDSGRRQARQRRGCRQDCKCTLKASQRRCGASRASARAHSGGRR
jgi:hypothetical protein